MENVINNKENETIVEIEKPVLRTELPNDVIAYLRETYPPRTNGAGIKQKDTVDYITEERSFAESENVNKSGRYQLRQLTSKVYTNNKEDRTLLGSVFLFYRQI